MKIAVTYENENIFQHFGHTEQMKIYTIENNKIVFSEVVSTNGSGHGALAGFLKALNVDVLICGGIGGGAKAALADANIKLYGGVSGNADKAVEALLNNTLNYNENVKCSHHEHNHENGHTCNHSHSCHKQVKPLTSENFEEEVLNNSGLVVVDFWAIWCGPCQMLSPIIDELCSEVCDVKFCKVNVDEQQELALKYNVKSIPTVVFIKNGSLVDTSIGYVPKEELLERIEKNK